MKTKAKFTMLDGKVVLIILPLVLVAFFALKYYTAIKIINPHGSYSAEEQTEGGHFWNAVIRDKEYWVYKDNICVDWGTYKEKEKNTLICTPSNEQKEYTYFIYGKGILYYLNSERKRPLVFSKFSMDTPLIE